MKTVADTLFTESEVPAALVVPELDLENRRHHTHSE